MDGEKKPRILYLDAARCLAVALIALNHAVNRTWNNYHGVQEEFAAIGLPSTVLKAMLTVASHVGVPLFLMITGALILRKRFETKEDLRRFYLHNWLDLLITGEIWFLPGLLGAGAGEPRKSSARRGPGRHAPGLRQDAAVSRPGPL